MENILTAADEIKEIITEFAGRGITLPEGVVEGLADLKAAVRGANKALAGDLEPWERREFERVRDTSQAELDHWIASINQASN